MNCEHPPMKKNEFAVFVANPVDHVIIRTYDTCLDSCCSAFATQVAFNLV